VIANVDTRQLLFGIDAFPITGVGVRHPRRLLPDLETAEHIAWRNAAAHFPALTCRFIRWLIKLLTQGCGLCELSPCPRMDLDAAR
jgi:hypothetical protein